MAYKEKAGDNFHDVSVGIGGNDAGEVFSMDEHVGHGDFSLVDEVAKEGALSVSERVVGGWHVKDQMVVLLSCLGLISRCFL